MTAFTWNFDIYVFAAYFAKKWNKMVDLGSEQASDTILFLKNYKGYDYH